LFGITPPRIIGSTAFKNNLGLSSAKSSPYKSPEMQNLVRSLEVSTSKQESSPKIEETGMVIGSQELKQANPKKANVNAF